MHSSDLMNRHGDGFAPDPTPQFVTSRRGDAKASRLPRFCDNTNKEAYAAVQQLIAPLLQKCQKTPG